MSAGVPRRAPGSLIPTTFAAVPLWVGQRWQSSIAAAQTPPLPRVIGPACVRFSRPAIRRARRRQRDGRLDRPKTMHTARRRQCPQSRHTTRLGRFDARRVLRTEGPFVWKKRYARSMIPNIVRYACEHMDHPTLHPRIRAPPGSVCGPVRPRITQSSRSRLTVPS